MYRPGQPSEQYVLGCIITSSSPSYRKRPNFYVSFFIAGRLERADTAALILEKPVILKVRHLSSFSLAFPVLGRFLSGVCRSDLCATQVKLENSIIYPGQEVPLAVDLDNCSNRVVKFIKVSLYQVSTHPRSTPEQQEFHESTDRSCSRSATQRMRVVGGVENGIL